MNENERIDQDLDVAGGAYAGSAYEGGGYVGGSSTQSPEEIERQIEATRSRMTRDIDAIGNKLNPRNLAAQASEKVTEQMRDTSRGFFDLVREHPLPAAAVGASVAWLVSRSRSEGPSGRRFTGGGYGGERTGFGAGYGYGGYAGAGYSGGYTGGERRLAGEHGPELEDDSPGAVERAKEKARNAADTVADKARGITHRAGDIAGHARERVGELSHRSKDLVQRGGTVVGEKWEQARTTLDRQTHENPLLVAAGAAVLGLAIGWLLPVTRKENEVFGGVRDDVVDRASETVDRVKDVATEGARQVADTVKTEAQNRAPELKKVASDIGNQVKDQVKETAGKAKQEAKDAATNKGTAGGNLS